jgi:succinate dehydrogenase / fumarate reductase cytochrome b subunit
LLGLIPVGGFLLFHMWENSQSRFGMEHYNEYVVEKISGINYVLLLEIFVIALPILAHAVYGVVIWWRGRANVVAYPYLRNWMWWLQRISGLGILLFLILHVGGTRILAIWDDGVAENMFGHMESLLSNPAYLTAYVVGLVLSVFHLCNGLWSMSIVWGLTTTARAQKIMQAAMAGLFVVLIALGIHGVLGFFLA